MGLPDPARQKMARDKLADWLARADTVYAVHYACESFSAGAQIGTPRVTAIAVHNLATGQTSEFSIRQMAELHHLVPAEITPNLATLERMLLDGFAQFVRLTKHARFLHWNMNSPTYGFAALSHRLQVLGGESFEVHDSAALDLARAVDDIYGSRYVGQRSKLQGLAQLNGLIRTGHLSGPDEATAFAEGRYRDIAVSCAAKASLIAEVMRRAASGRLRTTAGVVARHGGPLRLMIRKMYENPAYTIATGIAGGCIVMLKAYDYLFGG